MWPLFTTSFCCFNSLTLPLSFIFAFLDIVDRGKDDREVGRVRFYITLLQWCGVPQLSLKFNCVAALSIPIHLFIYLQVICSILPEGRFALLLLLLTWESSFPNTCLLNQWAESHGHFLSYSPLEIVSNTGNKNWLEFVWNCNNNNRSHMFLKSYCFAKRDIYVKCEIPIRNKM